MKCIRRTFSTLVLTAAIVAGTAGVASAAPDPSELPDGACMSGYQFQPLHCEGAPLELAGPFASWFDNLAKKAGGNR